MMALNRNEDGTRAVGNRHGSAALLAAGGTSAYVGTAAHKIGDRINAGHVRRINQKINIASIPHGYNDKGEPVQAPPKAQKFVPHEKLPPDQIPRAKAAHDLKQGIADHENRKAMANKKAKIDMLRTEAKKPLLGETGKGRIRGVGAALAVPTLWMGARNSVRSDKDVGKRDINRSDVDVAAVGGLASGSAYHIAGTKVGGHFDRKAKAKIEADPALKAKYNEYRNNSPKHNLPQRGVEIGDPRHQKFFRNYPKDLPGGKLKVLQSYTHTGRPGSIATGAVGVAGGLTLAHHAKKHVKIDLGRAIESVPDPVEKSLYVKKDGRHTGRRILTAGAGLGLLGIGLNHSPMVGRALATGLKRAQGKDAQATAQAIRMAQSAYGVMARGGRVSERQLRQIRSVNAAVNKVPPAIRPAVATTTGMLLLGNARNQGRSSYSPINLKINVHSGVSR